MVCVMRSKYNVVSNLIKLNGFILIYMEKRSIRIIFLNIKSPNGSHSSNMIKIKYTIAQGHGD